MTKTEFVESIAAKMDISKKHAAEITDAVIGQIQEVVTAGDSITFPGFGKFSVAERAARKGINPKTKQSIDIPASKSGKFSAGKNLKNL